MRKYVLCDPKRMTPKERKSPKHDVVVIITRPGLFYAHIWDIGRDEVVLENG